MHKILAVLGVFLLACSPVAALVSGVGFVATLNGAGTTASAVALNDRQAAAHHTLQVVIVSASVCTVRLEGSLDNSNWFDLSGTQTCTSNVMFHVDGKPVTYVRANLLTFTGSGVITISYQGSN